MTYLRPALLALFMLLGTLATISHATDLQHAKMTMDRYLAAQTRWQNMVVEAVCCYNTSLAD